MSESSYLYWTQLNLEETEGKNLAALLVQLNP